MSNELMPHDEPAATDPSLLADISATESEPSDEAAPPDEDAGPRAPSFDDMNLSREVRDALADMGYFTPTPVQTAVFGPLAEGKDLLVQSRTGTGKTAAFGLPILETIDPKKKAVQALILTPTRELALQVQREISALGKYKGVAIEPIYGGAPIGKQITALREGVHIVCGTPGRVLDHIGRRTLDLKNVKMFVLDECDEMLSMGFLEDIERVVSYLPKDKQTLLFSATMPDEVARYARRQMKEPERIALSMDGISVSDIHHAYYIVSGVARTRDLLKILISEKPESAIIFCNTRDETAMVARFLQRQGLDAEPISSDLTQKDRERVMGRMKAKNLHYLVATDVAARGIDISDLSHVINFTFPESAEVYVHRTGRTGRAGKKGTALSLIGPRELGSFYFLKVMYKIQPEERDLPKAEILEGVLKATHAHVGAPPPPDPVDVITAAVTGAPEGEALAVAKKVLASPEGERIALQLISEKLAAIAQAKKDAAKAAADAARAERAERGDRYEGGYGDREERPRYRDRDREDRPRFRDRDGGRDRDRGRDRDGMRGRDRDRDREERPRREREERVEERVETSEERPRFRDRDREDRPRREEREARPPREERDARPPREERDERPRRAETQDDRPRMTEGEERPRRDRDRDERPRRDREEREARPPREEAREARPPREEAREARPPREEAREERPRRDREEREARPPREEREARPPREEAREERPRRDREERPRREEPEAEVRAEAPAPKKSRSKNGAIAAPPPTDSTREFWETWADDKATRAPAEPREERPAREARAPREDRPRRERREGRSERSRDERPREERPARAATEDPTSLVRLYVSLGKDAGVTADDLRALLGKELGDDASRIGSVAMRATHSYVRVPEDLVERIVEAVNGTDRDGTEIKVELARG